MRAKISRRPAQPVKQNEIILSAIRERAVLVFVYNGEERVAEPQTYGVSVADHEVLRAYQRKGGSQSWQTRMMKLFTVDKISGLKKTGETFTRALPQHNPADRAMTKFFASLPAQTGRDKKSCLKQATAFSSRQPDDQKNFLPSSRCSHRPHAS